MALAFTDPEQWAAAYEAASTQQRYHLLRDVLAQPLSPQLVEELDLGMLLVEMQHQLVAQNQLEPAIDLIQFLQQHQPQVYQQEFAALDDLRVQYALYRNDPLQAQAALQQFIARPCDDIEQTVVVLNYLKFYDAVDLAVELCRAAYPVVASSPAVLPRTELAFSSVIWDAHLQLIQEQLQAQQPLDWDGVLAELADYGMDRRNMDEIVQAFQEDTYANIGARLKRNRDKTLQWLALRFCQAMTAQQMSFVCSHAIWNAVLGFWEARELPPKQRTQPDTYFAISAIQLERYVSQQIGGVWSMQQAVGVALVWGIPYVYEFLAARQIISPPVQQQALAAATNLKAAILHLPQLWKYDFVHRWQPPNSVSPAEAAAEAAQFARSLASVSPLSDNTENRRPFSLTALGSLAPFVER
ncbi:MAG: hypothetical protein IGS50_24495 [Synechococcales cyanobacterium C42_A2020_086]|jgi:hypothetical protein|nr:hypothetical protein [Synechococcales cyanobacterium M58_A2018_015]MBF2076901.1 hypothetical protein [Synechococcales cyanobacterium C42_A2020_086]